MRELTPTVKVVVFSGTEPRDSAEVAARVDGYALKDSQLDYLVELLETVGKQRTGQSAMHLDASRTSARDARAFTQSTLAAWGVDDSVDDVLLVVTELVNNAVTHARTDCELRLSVSPLSLRIEVIDGGGGHAGPAAAERDPQSRPRAAPDRCAHRGVGLRADRERRQDGVGRAAPLVLSLGSAQEKSSALPPRRGSRKGGRLC